MALRTVNSFVLGGLALMLGAGPSFAQGASSAAGAWPMASAGRIVFCGDFRRIDTGLIETYFATRFPQSEITLVYNDCRSLSSSASPLAPPDAVVFLPGADDARSIAEVQRIWPRTGVAGISAPATPLEATNALLAIWRAPSIVTAVEIDVLGKAVKHQERTTVRELEAHDFVSWTQDDEALPLPSDSGMPALNNQILTVTGLAAPQYRLTVDGFAVATFSRSQLASGVNLALLATPMAKQSAEVHSLTVRLSGMRAAGAAGPDQAELLNQRRAAAQPKTHDFELQPLPN